MRKLFIDFETQSEVPIKTAGLYQYVKGMWFKPVCMAYGFEGEEEIHLWADPDPFPYEIVTGNTLVAFNAEFEYQVLRWLGVDINIEDMIDVQAVGLTFGFPPSLDNMAKAMSVPYKKDAKGTRLINMLCVIKPPKYEVPTPATSPDKFSDLYDYCMQDIRVTRAVYNMLIKKQLSDYELQVFAHTIRQNERGLPVDRKSVNLIRKTLQKYVERCNNKLYRLTGGQISAGTQVDRITKYIKRQGYPELPNITAPTIQNILEENKLDDHCRQILRLRQKVSHSSTAKLNRLVDMIGDDDRIRGTLKYHGAHTGRFTGSGFQPHNMPRAQHKYPEGVLDDMRTLLIDDLEDKYGNLGKTASKLIRPMIMAPQGKQLLVADYVSIENVLLHWIANDQETVEDFRNGIDQYRRYASRRFNVDYDDVTDEQRTYAKPCILGLGYGGGYKALQNVATGYGVELSDKDAENDKKFYRNMYYKVPDLWYKVNNAMLKCVHKETILDLYTGTVSLKFVKRGTYAFIILPSGRFISYPAPLLMETRGPNYNEYFDDRRMTFTYMGLDKNKQWRRLGDPNYISPVTGYGEMAIHGGRLVENIVQALARDLLVYGGLMAEREGYKMLCSVHDEWIAEIDETVTGNNVVRMFCDAICQLPDWADGLPLRATGYVAKRYRKD